MGQLVQKELWVMALIPEPLKPRSPLWPCPSSPYTLKVCSDLKIVLLIELSIAITVQTRE
jgi:hypothetical protein